MAPTRPAVIVNKPATEYTGKHAAVRGRALNELASLTCRFMTGKLPGATLGVDQVEERQLAGRSRPGTAKPRSLERLDERAVAIAGAVEVVAEGGRRP